MLAAGVALLVVAAAAVIACLFLLPASGQRPRRRRPVLPPRPRQLTALESLVGSAGLSALQAHVALRPVLAEIAAQRLAAHGQQLDRLPVGVARERLGEPLWELVRPGRPFPADRRAPGPTPQQLTAMLDALERL